MTTHPVNAYLSILGKAPEYQGLFFQINQLNEIQQTFSTIAPSYLAQRCSLGRLTNGKLVIYTENGSIAAKLKHISTSLLVKLQKLGWEITAIQIMVQAPSHTKNTNSFSRKKLQLSQAGLENLSQLAATLPNSELKSAIEVLLKNQKKY